ncbi:alpha/beta hydrolase [Pseudarthrobacter sp. PS3-L1]|uniref:alpha/beta hydrolase n=1 Tax=Pseudarthrobacter sp. PS3-L1 TaxID=3046207 RepID=UPI0024B8D942|nr:alpha/beta hydrolase [Pseudarthrobacter sp. PS3-L1]MDJ0320926.1 alpha/beta hydrolase [Pseudarthrobacter sp. PS3-L1]
MKRHKYHYGEDPSQWGELFLPDRSGSAPTRGAVIVIHGGYWRSQYGAELGEPLAKDLAAHGMAAWNLEYRRAGNGGGWPTTFDDILSGIDKLGDIAGEHGIELGPVVALGHSAGGHLAAWAAGRDRLGSLGLPDADRQLKPRDSGHALHLTGVVSQSGLLNLGEAEKLDLSNGAVSNLLGGSATRYPVRHRYADPMTAIPLPVPVYAVHAMEDSTVPIGQSESYVTAARNAAGFASLLKVTGDHFDLIDTKSPAYRKCRELVQSLMA